MLRSLSERLRYDILRSPDNEGAGAGNDPDLILDDQADPADADPDQDDGEQGDDQQDPPLAADGADQGGGQQPDPADVRGRDTIRSLRARAQESERRASEALSRADEAERRIRALEQQHQQKPMDPEAEARLMESMTPEQRVDYKVNKALDRHSRDLQIRDFQTNERIDRASFEQECRVNPLASKYADAVERELTRIRSEGGNVPRQAVLFYVLGQALYSKQKATGDKRASKGQDRIRQQTTRPANSRGDVSGTRRGGTSLEDRLANVAL